MRALRFLGCAALAISGACGDTGAPAESVGTTRSAIEHPDAAGRSPATVALEWNGVIGCSGTLIGPATVLTAAHCVQRALPDGVTTVDGTTATVARSIVHPSFHAATLDHDLAIVRLTTGSPLPYATPTAPGELRAGDLLTIAGSTGPRALEADGNYDGTARVSSLDEARIGLAPGPSSPCGGDSGGSVFLSGDPPRRLVAVVSAGDVGCSRFAIATRVDAEAEFIASALADLDREADRGCSFGARRLRASSERAALAALLALVGVSLLGLCRPRSTRGQPGDQRRERAPALRSRTNERVSARRSAVCVRCRR